MHFGSLSRSHIGLQPRLETDVHLVQRTGNSGSFRLIRYVLSFTKQVGPTPLEIIVKCWIR